MKAQDFISLEEQYGAHNYKPLDVVIARGQGVWVYDVEGHKYLDCLSAYSAVNQGHCHPRLVRVLTEQASKLTLISRAFRNDQYGRFLQRLHEVTGYDMALPMNSGAEAVETALKLARKWAYTVKGVPRSQAEIITAQNNFHGRTITVISFSTEALYKDNFGPHTPGFVTVPYGQAVALEAAITPNTAAVLLEPIQGEAGVIVPPAGYLRQVWDICRRHNLLFIADEIQTGLGRTGKLFACEHEDVRPDVMIIGKALSGGMYPVSAVLADRDLMGLFQLGEHGSTFGGNPLGAAVATEALNVTVEEGLIENAATLGDYFRERLAEISSPNVKEVRGKGLLIGVEVKPEADGARRFCQALLERGILCKETHETVLRFAPPLIIDRETIDWALEPICAVLNMTSV
jgi:ornithine--oxo-acid transaminase